MTQLSEAKAREISAAARHERLCAAYDRGEPVKVALSQAHAEWVRARIAVSEAERGVAIPPGYEHLAVIHEYGC